MIGSLCTIADERVYDELLIMLKSAALFMPGVDLYVAGDKAVCERLPREGLTNRLRLFPWIPSGLRAELGNEDFVQIVSRKPDIVEAAVQERGSTLFLDADMIFFHAPWGIDLEHHELALTPHFILKSEEAKFGRFNSGYVGVSAARFASWWRDKIQKSKFVDQECLTQAPQEFRCQELTIQHNFGWWRLNRCDPKPKWWRFDGAHPPLSERRRAAFSVRKDHVLYEEQPLVCVHTHIRDRQTERYQIANRLVTDMLTQSTNPKHKLILSWL